MTGRNAVLERIIVKIILMIAEIVRTLGHAFSACCREAGQQLLAPRSGLSWPTMPKLETMGWHVPVAAPQGGLPAVFGERAACRYRSAPATITDNLVRAVRQAKGKLPDIEEPEAHDTRK